MGGNWGVCLKQRGTKKEEQRARKGSYKKAGGARRRKPPFKQGKFEGETRGKRPKQKKETKKTSLTAKTRCPTVYGSGGQKRSQKQGAKNLKRGRKTCAGGSRGKVIKPGASVVNPKRLS